MSKCCDSCGFSDKGSTISDGFYCFSCMVFTDVKGQAHKLFRDEDGFWKTQFDLEKRQVWLPTFVGAHPCPVEEEYQRYIGKLVVQ